MSGEWIDDLGLAELRAGVIKQAYRDYVNALITLAAFDYTKTLNPGKNMTAEFKRIRKNAETMSIYWSKKYPTKDSSKLKTRLRYIYQEARHKAEMIEQFFLSRRYELFADNLRGETLIRYAHDQIERWKRDEITRNQVLPNNAEEGIAAAQAKKERWRKT